jgi:hypothetical protein
VWSQVSVVLCWSLCLAQFTSVVLKSVWAHVTGGLLKSVCKFKLLQSYALVCVLTNIVVLKFGHGNKLL